MELYPMAAFPLIMTTLIGQLESVPTKIEPSKLNISTLSSILEEQKCTPGKCFGLKYNDLAKKYYKNIFQTQKQIRIKEFLWRKKHSKKNKNKFADIGPTSFLSQLGFHDNDLCCPTKLLHRNDAYMFNIQGQLKAIFHMHFLNPPRYQFFPHATCMGVGSCHGTCRLETTTVDLLVYNFNSPSWPFEFDTFEVPSYCSCKSS